MSIYPIIIQLGPEKLFKGIQPTEVFKESKNRLFTYDTVYFSTSIIFDQRIYI